MSESNPTVEYRPIQGFPNYRVGTDGSVWSRLKQINLGWRYGSRWEISDDWRRLKPSYGNSYGYPMVRLFPGGGTYSVHTLVLTAFVGPRPPGMQCCHGDGDPRNCNLSNLRWDTPKANQADSVRHGTKLRGEGHKSAKLTEAAVASIREQAADGKATMAALARKHGVYPSTVANVVHRRTWRHC